MPPFRSSVILLLSACALASSCSSTGSAPTTQPNAQKSALDDPMNYSPNMDSADVTGGKIDEFDKNAFKRDINHVFDP